MHQAVGTSRIIAHAVFLPYGVFIKIVDVLSVSVAQQITRFAPTHYSVSRIGPRSALIFLLASQEIQVKWIVVKPDISHWVQNVLEYLAGVLP